MAVVVARNFMVHIMLQLPRPVKLADMQLRWAPWSPKAWPGSSEADRDETVQVPVNAEVSAKGLCLFDGTTQVRATQCAQRLGIELMRIGILMASEKPATPREDIGVRRVPEIQILRRSPAAHLATEEHLLSFLLGFVCLSVHEPRKKRSSAIAMKRKRPDEAITIDGVDQRCPKHLHDARPVAEEGTTKVLWQGSLQCCSSRRECHGELARVPPTCSILFVCLKLQWRHSARPGHRSAPNCDHGATIEAIVVLHCDLWLWLQLSPPSSATQL
mmetsp:Transcript_48558/g.93786  ORF Transcript_48558/g.93786 Transcript_48558/m.93786 type:complete len:273 (+) Transcript_48558:245-1063(+)